MSARIIAVCDAVVAAIGAAWTPTAPDAVTRVYAPPVTLTADDPITVLTGRQVFVFGLQYSIPSLQTRADWDRTERIDVLVVERYTADSGAPPTAWLDARVDFVESLYMALRTPASFPLADTAWPQQEQPDPVIVYDRDVLLQHRTFWSQFTVNFEEVRSYGS
jgi:hypothetical protein